MTNITFVARDSGAPLKHLRRNPKPVVRWAMPRLAVEYHGPVPGAGEALLFVCLGFLGHSELAVSAISSASHFALVRNSAVRTQGYDARRWRKSKLGKALGIRNKTSLLACRPSSDSSVSEVRLVEVALDGAEEFVGLIYVGCLCLQGPVRPGYPA